VRARAFSARRSAAAEKRWVGGWLRGGGDDKRETSGSSSSSSSSVKPIEGAIHTCARARTVCMAVQRANKGLCKRSLQFGCVERSLIPVGLSERVSMGHRAHANQRATSLVALRHHVRHNTPKKQCRAKTGKSITPILHATLWPQHCVGQRKFV
jgi:hypothetical protein